MAQTLLLCLLFFSLASVRHASCAAKKQQPPGASPPSSMSIPRRILTPEEIETFRRDGVLVVRDLLTGRQLRRAARAAERFCSARSPSDRILCRLLPAYRGLKLQGWRSDRRLEGVAFDGDAPGICAQLMGLTEEADVDEETPPRPIRLLKDAVLGFQPGDTGCGWHVDDKTFWPCVDTWVGNQKAGINVWITLSPIRSSKGGGLAVAPRSHAAPWTEECRSIIASGGTQTTCRMEELSPECHERLESMKALHDLKPGDALFLDRYAFHRADPFHEEEEDVASASDEKGRNKRRQKRRRGRSGKGGGSLKMRYSIRYVPADAKFYDNGTERGAIEKGMVTGDRLEKGGEYYPQVWPKPLPEERQAKLKEDLKPNAFRVKKFLRGVSTMLLAGGLGALAVRNQSSILDAWSSVEKVVKRQRRNLPFI